MYTIEDIKKYDYFKNAYEIFILDSLTGVVARQYILEFAKYLIKNQMPFAMAMIDLDNFKSINDNYGHHIGDLCLKYTAEEIQKIVGNDGLVGRFGGDEFIILYLKSNKYDDIHDFFDTLYYDNGPLRKSVTIDGNKIFITATIGSASYPLNAEEYDDLFIKMDKALYRGKSKGRNCYIIYVHEKHKDIVIKEREGKSLLEKFERITSITEDGPIEQVRASLIDYLYRVVHPYNVVFITKDNFIQSGAKTKWYHYEEYQSFDILNKILGDENVVAVSDTTETMDGHPNTKKFIEDHTILAYVVTRVGNYGFIVVLENSVSRMWQDSDLVLLYFAANQLKMKLDKEN